MEQRLKDKVALVTGAGSIGPGMGNGKATAVLFARQGAKIFAIDKNPDAVKETKSIIEGEGGECAVCKADVSKSNEVKAMVEQCVNTYGRIDILHNNVGIVEVGGPVEITEENWDRLIAVNLKSMFLTCKYCIPLMIDQGGGAIVNVSSISSIRDIGYPCVSYSASKGGINQLTQNIAIKYADKGIRANCVLPGLMNTPQIVAYLPDDAYSGGVEGMIKKREALVPMKKMGDAWDVAYAALFLASDEAKYITGVELIVDGGITCKFA